MSHENDLGTLGRTWDQETAASSAYKDTADAEIARLDGIVTDLQNASAAADQIIAGLQASNATKDAEIARLKGLLPVVTRKGSSGGQTGTTVAAAVAKWPAADILRCFKGDGTYLDPNLLPKGVMLAFSNKPDLVAFAAGKYDAAEAAWAAQVHAKGDPVVRIVYHEPDVKMNQYGNIGGHTVTEWAAAQDHLAALYDGDPLVVVSIVVAAHCLTGPVNGRTAESWMRPGVKSYGFDFDGNRGTTLPYVDYTPEVARMTQIKALGVDVWVPEFGVPPVAADADRSKHAAWLTSTAAALVAAGASKVCLFDTAPEGPLSGLSQTAWSTFLAT